MKVIEDQTTVHEIVQSLTVRLQQILSSLGKDDPGWQKIEVALDLAFYQVQAKVQSLQDSFDLIQEQLQLLAALQNSFVSAMDMQTIILRACELIPQYTGANSATIYLYDEHQNALIPGNSPGVLQTNVILSLDSPSPLQTEAKRCFKEGRSLVIDDWASADGIPVQKGNTRDVKSTLMVPVAVKQQVIGVLQIDFTQQMHHFIQNEIDFFD